MYAIAIDMGGTKIEGSLVDENAKISETYRIPTEAEAGAEKVIANLVAVIMNLKNKKVDIKGVGISMPGFFNSSGKILFGGGATNCLEGINLKKELEKKTGLKVFLGNDANCFALAEATYGAGKKHSIVIGIIWGTGVGCGIVIDKKIYAGANGAAGEFGHIIINPAIKSGQRCSCGQFSCLEMMASGKNIVRLYKEMGGKIKNPDPSKIYNSKEEIAKEIMADAINNTGLGVAALVNLLDPNIIVFGGGVSKLPESAYLEIEKKVRRYALPFLANKVKIVRHSITDSIGILGAAALVFQNSNEIYLKND